MNCHEGAGHTPELHKEEADVEGIIRDLVEQFSILLGNPDRVAECCQELEQCMSAPPSVVDIERVSSFLPLLAEHSGPPVVPLYDFIERTATVCPDPWPLLKGMLAARDKPLVQRSLRFTLRCIDDHSLRIDRRVVEYLAGLLDTPGKCIDDSECLPAVGRIVRHLTIPGKKGLADPVPALFLGERNEGVRRLAARILDIPGAPITADLARKALGEDVFGFLGPYLAYTRASHTDVLSLVPSPGVSPPILPSLRKAQDEIGESVLRNIIAEAGWQQLNLGLEVRHYVPVILGDSIPLMFTPAEARLARRCGEVRLTADLFLAIAHGGKVTETANVNTETDPASRFRNYNLAHADVLSDFLAVAPLTAERIHHILMRMDAIVGEFIGLFSSVSEETSILRGVYDSIKNEILARLNAHGDREILSPDVTRLTVMFEDPKTPGEVRTLHGLKRYLHQKGLQLGFKLVQRTLSTDRTVNLFLCSRKRILQKVEGIRYADFEPETDGMPASINIPYPVAVVANGFARQLLYGHESYPRADIFCYGNEVHYFLSFRNHPAFLRINYSPPLQGGMIDLEYYGVSKYELSSHPDFSLNALQKFFRALGFHVEVENTRVHARYDKEHTPDFKSLRERAESLFCLAPYLLDIDWTIGGLNLKSEARHQVTSAWAESFASWGVLPLRLLLTRNRQGVIERIVDTPAGRQEVEWSGETEYRDRFRFGEEEFFRSLFAVAGYLDPENARIQGAGVRDRNGQLQLERLLLFPLREAKMRGELKETAKGYERTSPELFQRMSETEKFAELLAMGDNCLDSAAALASLIAPLGRFLSFRTSGMVGCFEVQSACLHLQDEEIGIYVMRGEGNTAVLAFYTHGVVLYRRRDTLADPWRSNTMFDTTAFLALLRRSNYPVPGLGQLPPGILEEVHRIRENLVRALPAEPRRPVPGEQIVAGVRATPGRATGRVLFGTKGRTPRDFTDAVLVTSALQPQDAPYLQRAAAVVSTGGGILSHAALLAAQYHKPAIIITGKWESDQNLPPSLYYTGTEYEVEEQELYGFRVCTRRQIRECEHVLHEGDLVAIDAKEDLLRVLGQDPDTLALHDALRQLSRTTRDLTGATNDHDILRLRGRKIRAEHQVGKILTRVTDPVLTCHAIDEILQDSGAEYAISGGDRARFLNLMLNNQRVSATAATHLRWIVRDLRQHAESALRNVRDRMPSSCTFYEALSLRLDALRASQSFDEVSSSLAACGIRSIARDPSAISVIDQLARQKLIWLRNEIGLTLASFNNQISHPRCRHLIRQWERTECLVNASGKEKASINTLRVRLLDSDETTRKSLGSRAIIWPDDGGLELFPFIGWKAANLGEIVRITGGSMVPPWFVVTDRVFQDILVSPRDRIFPKSMELPHGAPSLGRAIEAILTQPRLDRLQKASAIRNLWDSVIPPPELAAEVLNAYRHIGGQESPGTQTEADGVEPLVALRSSSREEDAEIAARAGEFDTFLFIRGEESLLKFLLRTWSGLWSDRALHTREMLGATTPCTGGGVIIQQIVNARVSGVLQTMNPARNDFREIVINASWGLGEGIVSGTVAADQIIVSKDGDLEKGPLRFSYVTADKREYVVFNKRAGFGTIRCEAPYHQRLRPALEYSELSELVAVVTRLEASYGYPLDVEFAIEGSRLWILQVRPVPASLSLLQETLQNYPLTGTKCIPRH